MSALTEGRGHYRLLNKSALTEGRRHYGGNHTVVNLRLLFRDSEAHLLADIADEDAMSSGSVLKSVFGSAGKIG